jgi:hypothetical protein
MPVTEKQSFAGANENRKTETGIPFQNLRKHLDKVKTERGTKQAETRKSNEQFVSESRKTNAIGSLVVLVGQ